MQSMHEYTQETDELAKAVVEYTRRRIADPQPLDHPVPPDELGRAAGATITSGGIGGQEALRIWAEVLAPATITTDHPSFLSFVPGVIEVAQEMRVPIVRDEWWEVRDSVSAQDDGSYRIAWTLVRARTTKSVTGYAHFEPYHNTTTGRDGTLLTYHNFVWPGSGMAKIGLVERHALKKVRETVRALRDHVERARREDPERVAMQVAALREMVGKGAKGAEGAEGAELPSPSAPPAPLALPAPF